MRGKRGFQEGRKSYINKKIETQYAHKKSKKEGGEKKKKKKREKENKNKIKKFNVIFY